MHLTIIWDNPFRSLISTQEFGRKMSFKNKLGFRPASLSRSIEINMTDKINMTWKRQLARAVNNQFQTDRKATVYFSGLKEEKQSGFVVSAKNSKHFSNEVANGILQMRGQAKGLNNFDNITEKSLMY